MTCCNGAIARVIPISLMLSKAEKRLGGVKLIYKVHRKRVCAVEDSVQVPTVVDLRRSPLGGSLNFTFLGLTFSAPLTGPPAGTSSLPV